MDHSGMMSEQIASAWFSDDSGDRQEPPEAKRTVTQQCKDQRSIALAFYRSAQNPPTPNRSGPCGDRRWHGCHRREGIRVQFDGACEIADGFVGIAAGHVSTPAIVERRRVIWPEQNRPVKIRNGFGPVPLPVISMSPIVVGFRPVRFLLDRLGVLLDGQIVLMPLDVPVPALQASFR
jgi:hypothetical protein